jgi:hypothetical protein
MIPRRFVRTTRGPATPEFQFPLQRLVILSLARSGGLWCKVTAGSSKWQRPSLILMVRRLRSCWFCVSKGISKRLACPSMEGSLSCHPGFWRILPSGASLRKSGILSWQKARPIFTKYPKLFWLSLRVEIRIAPPCQNGLQ